MAALAAGGGLGTLARYGVDRALPANGAGFPWATLTVNVVGSFVLAVVLTLVVERWPGDRWLRPLAGVGFCGGFTTFSTLIVELDQRVRNGHTATAGAYLAATLVLGLGAALAGMTLARGRLPVPDRRSAIPDPDLLVDDDPAGRQLPDGEPS